MKTWLFLILAPLVNLNAQQYCVRYVLEHKEIIHYHGGHCGHTEGKVLEFHWEISYPSLEECSSSMTNAIKNIDSNECANTEVIIIKACICSEYESVQDNTLKGRNTSPEYATPTYSGTPGKASGKSAQNNPVGDSMNTGRNVGNTLEQEEGASPNANPAVILEEPQNDREGLIRETITGAAPGIQNAVGRYLAEKEMQRSQPMTHDSKPEGYRSSDIPRSEWVMAEGGEVSAAVDAGEEGSSWWEEVKSYFGWASTTSEIVGQEEHANTFGSASKVMGYVETAGHVTESFKNPHDDNARMEVVKDAFSYLGDASGTAGAAFNKFGPPADLHQRTFEGAFQRMNSLIETGDPGDEIAVTAPLLNWFGSAAGMGNIGTRERIYRLEGYKPFSELKAQYGWKEAVKQKVYNWIREE